jgi:hypothetical protein
MKLFDITGGQITIHADMLGLPPFKKVWEVDKDKEHAINLISYIVLMWYYKSPYVQQLDPETREKKLKGIYFGDENYSLTIDEKICESDYKDLIYTRNLKMLDSMRNKIDTISQYYEDSLSEELDERKIKDLLAGMEKVKATFQTLDFLEKAVKAEEYDSVKVRGDSKINPYELVNSKR